MNTIISAADLIRIITRSDARGLSFFEKDAVRLTSREIVDRLQARGVINYQPTLFGMRRVEMAMPSLFDPTDYEAVTEYQPLPDAAFDYDPDCASCLAGREHTITQHEDHLRHSAESGDDREQEENDAYDYRNHESEDRSASGKGE